MFLTFLIEVEPENKERENVLEVVHILADGSRQVFILQCFTVSTGNKNKKKNNKQKNQTLIMIN